MNDTDLERLGYTRKKYDMHLLNELIKTFNHILPLDIINTIFYDNLYELGESIYPDANLVNMLIPNQVYLIEHNDKKDTKKSFVNIVKRITDKEYLIIYSTFAIYNNLIFEFDLDYDIDVDYDTFKDLLLWFIHINIDNMGHYIYIYEYDKITPLYPLL